jgi:hypothetical protein
MAETTTTTWLPLFFSAMERLSGTMDAMRIGDVLCRRILCRLSHNGPQGMGI